MSASGVLWPAGRHLTPRELDLLIAYTERHDGATLEIALRSPVNMADNRYAAACNGSMTTTEHTPIILPRSDYPGEIGQIGCSCGFRPLKPAQTATTMATPFRNHVKKTLGVRVQVVDPVYPVGHECAGLTWDEARRA